MSVRVGRWTVDTWPDGRFKHATPDIESVAFTLDDWLTRDPAAAHEWCLSDPARVDDCEPEQEVETCAQR